MHVSPGPVARKERGDNRSVPPAQSLSVCEAVPDWPSYLLDVERIYLEPAAEQYAHGRAILDHFPAAERIRSRATGAYRTSIAIARWRRRGWR